jgi:hypothetical protein
MLLSYPIVTNSPCQCSCNTQHPTPTNKHTAPTPVCTPFNHNCCKFLCPQESLATQAATARQADTAAHQAAAREASLDRMSGRVAEEGQKTAALRHDLAAMTQQHVSIALLY